MLAYLDTQFYELEPVPAPVGEFRIVFNPKTMTIESYKGPNRVFIGPKYYSDAAFVDIDPQTGKIEVKDSGIVAFRVVFTDFHIDMNQQFTVNRPETPSI